MQVSHAEQHVVHCTRDALSTRLNWQARRRVTTCRSLYVCLMVLNATEKLCCAQHPHALPFADLIWQLDRFPQRAGL